MNKLPTRSGFHLQMTHNYFISLCAAALLFPRYVFFPQAKAGESRHHPEKLAGRHEAREERVRKTKARC